MKRKGFTLTELLGTIVVLAIIAIIAVPAIQLGIENARKEAFRDSVYQTFSEIQYYLVKNNIKELPEEGIEVKDIEFKNNNFTSGKLIMGSKNTIKAVNVSDGRYCAIGEKDELEIYEGECDLSIPTCEIRAKDQSGVNGWYAKNPMVEMETMPVKSGYLTYGIGIRENYDYKIVGRGKVGKAEYKTVGDVPVTVYCYVKNLGEMKGENKTVISIDKTAPTKSDFTYKISYATGRNLTIEASGVDNESGIGMYQFSIDGGKTWTKAQSSAQYTYKNLDPIIYDVRVRVYNGTYVESEKENNLHTDSEIKRISMAELVTPTYQVTPTGWTANPVNVTVTFQKDGVYLIKPTIDVISNVNAKTCSYVSGGQYTCDGASTTTLKANTWYQVTTSPTLTFADNGSIVAQVSDGINYKGASTLNVNNIDKTPALASMIINNPMTDRYTLILTCSDSESGVTKYEFSSDGGSTWVNKGMQTSHTFTGLKKETSYRFVGRCTNGSKLTSTIEKSGVTLGMTNPAISQTSATPGAGYSWATKRVMKITYYTTNVQTPIYYFKSTGTATVGSGVVTGICGTGNSPGACSNGTVTTLVANTWYRTGSATPSITYTSNGTLIAVLGDGTNLSSSATATISNISTGVPTVPTISGGSTEWTNTGRTISVTGASSETSGIKNYQYCISTSASGCNGTWTNGSSVTVTTEGTYYVYMRAVANNGNVSGASSPQIVRVDRNSPTASWSLSGTTATVTCSDANINPNYSGTSFTLSGTSNQTLSYTCRDLAGNAYTTSQMFTYNPRLNCTTTCQYGCDSVYNDCKTGSNTCQGGNVCTQGQMQSNGRCALYAQYTLESGMKRFESMTSCAADGCYCHQDEAGWYCDIQVKTCPSGYRLNSSETTCYKYVDPVYNECATGSNTCQGGYEEKNCSNCKTQQTVCNGGFQM